MQNCKACLIRSGVRLFQHSLSIQFSWCPYDIFQNGKNWWSERLTNERCLLILASLNLHERVIRFSRPFLRFLAFLPRIFPHFLLFGSYTGVPFSFFSFSFPHWIADSWVPVIRSFSSPLSHLVHNCNLRRVMLAHCACLLAYCQNPWLIRVQVFGL